MKKLSVFALTAASLVMAASSAFASECVECNQGPPVVGGVPEPSTWAMLIVGIGAIGVAARLRKRAAQSA
jgi:hypothetical protein